MSEALSAAWRLRALAACAVLPPLVSLVPLTRISALAGRLPARPARSVPDDAELSAYVAAVLYRLPPPWRYTCLRRGVVMYHLLRRAGRAVELRIGVRKTPGGPLAAHAWLVKDGEPYLETGDSGHASFTVIASFPDAGAPS